MIFVEEDELAFTLMVLMEPLLSVSFSYNLTTNSLEFLFLTVIKTLDMPVKHLSVYNVDSFALPWNVSVPLLPILTGDPFPGRLSPYGLMPSVPIDGISVETFSPYSLYSSAERLFVPAARMEFELQVWIMPLFFDINLIA